MLTYNELIELRDKLANGEIGVELANQKGKRLRITEASDFQ